MSARRVAVLGFLTGVLVLGIPWSAAAGGGDDDAGRPGPGANDLELRVDRLEQADAQAVGHDASAMLFDPQDTTRLAAARDGQARDMTADLFSSAGPVLPQAPSTAGLFGPEHRASEDARTGGAVAEPAQGGGGTGLATVAAGLVLLGGAGAAASRRLARAGGPDDD